MGVFVCLMGPPAVGKSTVAAGLAEQAGVQVFRLREFAQDLREREPLAGRLFAVRDSLGWFGDGAVAYCLRRAVVEGGLPAAGVVAMENLPGSHTQLGQLDTVAAGRGLPLVLVELDAPDEVLSQRAAARRVCPNCEQDPEGDPHRPARGRASEPEVCATCGGGLAPRPADRPEAFVARLARFRERIGDIRRGAAARGRPYHVVDATAAVEQCVAQVAAAYRPLLRRRKIGGPRR